MSFLDPFADSEARDLVGRISGEFYEGLPQHFGEYLAARHLYAASRGIYRCLTVVFAGCLAGAIAVESAVPRALWLLSAACAGLFYTICWALRAALFRRLTDAAKACGVREPKP